MKESRPAPQLHDFLVSRLPQLLCQVKDGDAASDSDFSLLQEVVEELGHESYTPSLGFTALASLIGLLGSPSGVLPPSSRHWTIGAVAELVLQLASRDPLLSRLLRIDIEVRTWL